MTRKDYEKIAKAINETRDFYKDYSITVTVAELLATEFRKDNPRFDAVKFYSACGF